MSDYVSLVCTVSSVLVGVSFWCFFLHFGFQHCCRAMLCIMLSCGVCLSVCPSVTFVFFLWKRVFVCSDFFSHHSSFFPTKPCGNWRVPSNECEWINRDFRPISPFISEMIKIEPLLLWKANRTRHSSFRMVPWPWVTSNPDFKVNIIF